MDPLQTEQGAVWAQVAPLILARQREVADRVEATVAADPVIPQFNRTTIRAPERGDGARGVLSGEAGLGQSSGAGRTAARTQNITDARGLTEGEQKMVAELKSRDAEVRRHEQAHAAVGGQYASAPTYTYQTGPDGRQYAIGGAVQIDVSPVDGDPDATITKMEVVKAAALAPAEPSAADRQVAALADAQRAQAVADLASLRAARPEAILDKRA